LTPAYVRQHYGFDNIWFPTAGGPSFQGDGRGQTIAIIAVSSNPSLYPIDTLLQDNVVNDLRTFNTQFGLVQMDGQNGDPTLTRWAQDPNAHSFHQVTQNRLAQNTRNTTPELEMDLDVQWAHAIAPRANIVIVGATDNFQPEIAAAAQWASSLPGVSVVNLSLFAGIDGGTGLATVNHSNDGAYSHPGVTFVAATGDFTNFSDPSGASIPFIANPADLPTVLAVGGTMLQTASDGSSPEVVWDAKGYQNVPLNDTAAGVSSLPKPSFQQLTVPGTFTGRAVPDVTYLAQTFPIFDSFDFGQPLEVWGAASDSTGKTVIATEATIQGIVYGNTTAGMHNGDLVTINGVNGDTNANGTWSITVLDGTHFQLTAPTDGRPMTNWFANGTYDARPRNDGGFATFFDQQVVQSSSTPAGWAPVTGTSAGAPQWSALIAIANQGRALNPQTSSRGPLNGIDQTLPMIYSLPASDFMDITTGTNGLYKAGPGYDLVTGRGSPRADLVVRDLVAPYHGYWAAATDNSQLTVYGNDSQGNLGGTDHITLDISPDGNYLVVTDNIVGTGTTLTDKFDLRPGFRNFDSVTVNTRSSNDIVDVLNTPAGIPVTINLGGSNDTANISPTSFLLTSLGADVTVNGGNGRDTLNVYDQNNGGPNGDYWLTANSFTRTFAPTVNFFGMTNGVNLYGGNGNTYQVGRIVSGPVPPSGAPNASITLDTGFGSNASTVRVLDLLYTDPNNSGQVDFSLDGLSNLRITGRTADSLIVDNTVTPTLPAGITALPQTFTATGDPSEGGVVSLKYSYQTSSAGISFTWAPAPFSFTYSGIGNLEFDGGLSGETFQVGDGVNSLDWLPTNLSISVVGQGGDNLVINDHDQPSQAKPTFTSTNPVFTVTGQSVTRDNAATAVINGTPVSGTTHATIGYSGIASLEVDGGDSPNTFNVISVNQGTPVTLQGGNGGDQFVLGDSGNNLDNFSDALTILGGTGKDAVIVNDQADVDAGFAPRLIYDLRNALVQAPNGQTFDGQTLSRTGTFPDGSIVGATVNFANVASVALNASPYGNEIDVESTRASIPVTVNAGSGNDTINAGSGADRLGALQGALMINGQGGNTTLNVNDQGTPVAQTYEVYHSSIHRLSANTTTDNIAPIGYSQVGNVFLNMGLAQTGTNSGRVQNVVDVFSTAAGTITTVNGGPGNNGFWVAPYDGGALDDGTGILGDVHLNGGTKNPLNYFYYFDYLNPAPQTYTLTAGQMVDTGFRPVTYDGNIGTVGLYTSRQGNNKVNVLSTIAGWTTVNAEASDTITAGSQAPGLGGTLAGLASGGDLLIQQINNTQKATVILDDSGDTQMGKQVTFNRDSYDWGISGLAPQRIYLDLGTGSNIQVLGGSPAAGQTGGNTYDIQSTPAGTSLTVKAGRGTDTVNVGGAAAQTLDPILGSVTVNGQGANTTLNYDDRNSTPTNYYWYEVSPTTLVRMQVTYTSGGSTNGPLEDSVTYSGIGTLSVNAHNVSAAAGSSYYAVYGTAQGTTTNLDAGAGYNEYIVSGTNYNLGAIQGPLFLHGSGDGYPNNNLVFIDDLFDPKPQRFLLTAGTTSESGMVQRFALGSTQPNMAAINYDGINSYAVVATANTESASSSHNDTVDIQGNAANLWTIVEAGTGDTVNVGTPAHTMDGISGDLRIQAVAGQTPTVNLDDSGDTAKRTIDLADEGSGYGYRVTGLLAPGGPGRGRIWLLDPAMKVTLKTGAGNNVFRVHDSKEVPALTLHGGAGTNWLDYSAYGSGVTVNLATGTATGFAGISGIENVVGSLFNDSLTGDARNNVLIGLGGNDTLRAGSGRDILIGGDGNSTLQGGSGQDILIGGWTTYDRQVDSSGAVQHAVNYDALDAILAEWAGTDSFAVRQRAIASGVGSGKWALNAATVLDDGVTDSLLRNGGTDWIFAGRNDKVS
jgi:hypothetical protein